jgi:hypothetical protein
MEMPVESEKLVQKTDVQEKFGDIFLKNRSNGMFCYKTALIKTNFWIGLYNFIQGFVIGRNILKI